MIIGNIAAKLYPRAVCFDCAADEITLKAFDSFMESLRMGEVYQIDERLVSYNFFEEHKNAIAIVFMTLQTNE